MRTYCGEFTVSTGISVACEADDTVSALSRGAGLAQLDDVDGRPPFDGLQRTGELQWLGDRHVRDLRGRRRQERGREPGEGAGGSSQSRSNSRVCDAASRDVSTAGGAA